VSNRDWSSDVCSSDLSIISSACIYLLLVKIFFVLYLFNNINYIHVEEAGTEPFAQTL
jgi:hypothetical protein